MNSKNQKFNLILNSYRYHLKQHILLILGIILTTSIICGSLIIGDSIRSSLTAINREKLGDIEWVISAGDRYFKKFSNRYQTMLAINATMVRGESITISEKLSVYGIDEKYSELYDLDFIKPGEGEVVINKKVADLLDTTVGSTITVVLEKPSHYPVEAPLSSRESETVSLRLKIVDIIPNRGTGRFSLNNNQRVPSNIFVNRDFLNVELGLDNRSNLILIDENVTKSEIQDFIRSEITIEDLGYSLKEIDEESVMLTTDRIFIDDNLIDNINDQFTYRQNFSYFINRVESTSGSTPYSFITTKDNIEDGQIVLSSWAAEDLKVSIGDSVELSYFKFTNNLIEETTKFTVSDIIDIDKLQGTEKFIPPFYGLYGTQSCSQWEPGIPLDLERIRDKDEDYWTEYNNRPKFFVSEDSAIDMWANSYGSATGLIINRESVELLENYITTLDPKELSLSIIDIKNNAIRAGMNSVDFTELFLGLSFFLIIAAMLFSSIICSYFISSRKSEILTLSAIGFRNREIKQQVFSEILISVFLGAIFGLIISTFYTQLILEALKSVWNPAIRTTDLKIFIYPQTLLMGLLLSLIITPLTLLSQMKKLSKLLPGAQLKQTKPTNRKRLKIICLVIVVLTTLVLVISLFVKESSLYFVSGFLSLCAFILITNLLLTEKVDDNKNINFRYLIWNLLRTKKSQSLGIIILLSCCFFLTTTVSVNRKDVNVDINQNSSGSGGYGHLIETALPMTSKQLDRLEDIDITTVRVAKGDDFSCLNLNKIEFPRVIGIDPSDLKERNSFSFEAVADGYDKSSGWDLLQSVETDYIPAAADLTAITWGLGLKLGDFITIESETGEILNLKLVAGLKSSILQGNLLISEELFKQYFPSTDGYRMFLIDINPTDTQKIEVIKRVLRPYGLEMISVIDRLNELNSVTNSYLDIFFILGFMSLILGTLALAILILRNSIEERSQTEMLRALGYKRRDLLRINVSRYIILLLSSILFGTTSSIISVIPVLFTENALLSILMAISLSILVGFIGFLFILISSILVSRKKQLSALRRE